MRTLLLTLTMCLFVLPAQAKYSGGTGEPNDPYQIATAADLIALGETPEDYDKRFILTADLDLDPNLPGRRVFDKAVIAPVGEGPLNIILETPFFTGIFDGDGHMISHLTIKGTRFLGLFGLLASGAQVRDLAVVDVNVIGDFFSVGGLVGSNGGTVSQCYSTGVVSGAEYVGGLVGHSVIGTVTKCYSTGSVSGMDCVGGLVGYNGDAVIQCYNSSTVAGNSSVGGLVGYNAGDVTQCYSIGTVEGDSSVGGLVGCNAVEWFPGGGTYEGAVADCYSTGDVSGRERVGGLVGENGRNSGPAGWCLGMATISRCYSVSRVFGEVTAGGFIGVSECGSAGDSFWDIVASAQMTSPGGTGKATGEMQTAATFLEAGWDFVGETANGSEDIWKIAEGLGYPRLSWERYSGGTGELNDPYQIATAADLIALGETGEDYNKHFVLTADIDLDPNLPGGTVFDRAVIAPDTNDTEDGFQGTPFTGVFAGSGHWISHLTIRGGAYLGLFGQTESGAKVKDLGVVDVNITGSGACVGGLVGANSGAVTQCYSTGAVSGAWGGVGGLVGDNGGTITHCYSSTAVVGASYTGGLVGCNERLVDSSYSTGAVRTNDGGGLVGGNGGTVSHCYCTGTVSWAGGSAEGSNGGLVGDNQGFVTQCYSTGSVNSRGSVGGSVGHNEGSLTDSYSTGAVNGNGGVGGLVGTNGTFYEPYFRYESGTVSNCYSTGVVSGIHSSVHTGGLVGVSVCGPVTACFWDMESSGQAISAGGTGLTAAEMHDIQTFSNSGWSFADEIKNGSHNIWQMPEGGGYPVLAIFNGYVPPRLQGAGTQDDPYLIFNAVELWAMFHYNPYAYYRLAASVDLAGICWAGGVIPRFAGVFDGTGHTISHMTIIGDSDLGLFGELEGEVKNLGVVDVNVIGSACSIGALVGFNRGGTVTQCYSTGTVSGNWCVGGLVGQNNGRVKDSYTAGSVTGNSEVGGLVGITGDFGWFAHRWPGTISNCYSASRVTGADCAGGLVEFNDFGEIDHSFWDVEVSSVTNMCGGNRSDTSGCDDTYGKTTAEMQMASTFLDAGWDFVGEAVNGAEDIWWINEGKDYPRLWWEERD